MVKNTGNAENISFSQHQIITKAFLEWSCDYWEQLWEHAYNCLLSLIFLLVSFYLLNYYLRYVFNHEFYATSSSQQLVFLLLKFTFTVACRQIIIAKLRSDNLCKFLYFSPCNSKRNQRNKQTLLRKILRSG